MLGLLGLLGALGAGLALDALFAHPSSRSDEDDSLPPEEDEADTAAQQGRGDFLIDAGAEDGTDTQAEAEPDPEQGAVASLQRSEDDPAHLQHGSGRADKLYGGDQQDDQRDRIRGHEGDDQIIGYGGNDTLYGGRGDDVLTGDDGDLHATGEDRLFGGRGADTLSGDDGDDRLVGGADADRLVGGRGDDLLRGGYGTDTLMGGEGQDSLSGGKGDDWLEGGYGDDLLEGGRGSDTLDGSWGNDTLRGHVDGHDDGDVDFLNGGAGEDVLVAGAGDYLSGGDGADRFQLGDWLEQGDSARILDYDPAQDQIEVVYDPKAHPDPRLTLSPSGDQGDMALFLDGMPLAVVQNGAGLDLAAIRLTAAG